MIDVVPDTIFAAVDAVDAYRGSMYGEGDSGMTRKIVLGGLVVLVIWVALYVFDRLQKARKAKEALASNSLFATLCSNHRLTSEERQRLEVIAERESVAPQEAIFLRPEAFLRGAQAERDKNACEQIRKKIFGELEVAAS